MSNNGPNSIKVHVQGDDALVVDPPEAIVKGHQLIVWQLVDPVKGTGGTLVHQWDQTPTAGVFSPFTAYGSDFGTMDDKNPDSKKNEKTEKGPWKYSLTLTTSTNTYSTTMAPMGNPNIRNN